MLPFQKVAPSKMPDRFASGAAIKKETPGAEEQIGRKQRANGTEEKPFPNLERLLHYSISRKIGIDFQKAQCVDSIV
ncbi:hypothetical protein EGJ57_00610 [Brucella anthropi]|nr:hypothetical protein EGJ57_00610 [Brucella anthropi]